MKKLVAFVIKKTIKLPFNLFYKKFGSVSLIGIEPKIKDLKQLLKILPDDEWVLIKKYTRRR